MSEQIAMLFELMQFIAKYKEYNWCKLEFFADGSGYFYKDRDYSRQTFSSPAEGITILWNLLSYAHSRS